MVEVGHWSILMEDGAIAEGERGHRRVSTDPSLIYGIRAIHMYP